MIQSWRDTLSFAWRRVNYLIQAGIMFIFGYAINYDDWEKRYFTS